MQTHELIQFLFDIPWWPYLTGITLMDPLIKSAFIGYGEKAFSSNEIKINYTKHKRSDLRFNNNIIKDWPGKKYLTEQVNKIKLVGG